MPRSQKTNGSTKESLYLGALSTLLFDRSGNDGQFSSSFTEALEFCSSLPDAELREVFDLADSHHVTVRVINILQDGAAQTGRTGLAPRRYLTLLMEKKRLPKALHYWEAICGGFGPAGCQSIVKSRSTTGPTSVAILIYTQAAAEN